VWNDNNYLKKRAGNYTFQHLKKEEEERKLMQKLKKFEIVFHSGQIHPMACIRRDDFYCLFRPLLRAGTLMN
jgi:hypothetical protein